MGHLSAPAPLSSEREGSVSSELVRSDPKAEDFGHLQERQNLIPKARVAAVKFQVPTDQHQCYEPAPREEKDTPVFGTSAEATNHRRGKREVLLSLSDSSALRHPWSTCTSASQQGNSRLLPVPRDESALVIFSLYCVPHSSVDIARLCESVNHWTVPDSTPKFHWSATALFNFARGKYSV
ncbi:hypothetical protein BKA93DRAFT_160325 [Sparassis latifolia]